jgi:hypothetical protein
MVRVGVHYISYTVYKAGGANKNSDQVRIYMNYKTQKFVIYIM